MLHPLIWSLIDQLHRLCAERKGSYTMSFEDDICALIELRLQSFEVRQSFGKPGRRKQFGRIPQLISATGD